MDPIRLEIYRNLFDSVAGEMGTVLKRTAYSPNIKERRDYSCAVFDGFGEVVAMGAHMPVHLGSMPLSVQSAIKGFRLNAGDLVILNDPFAGGTHLPDITMVLPVYPSSEATKPLFYVSARAHHSDVGGMTPGSMPLSRDIFQEGIRIPPVKLYESGALNRAVLHLLLHNVRTPLEREGDLAAQVGALRVGERRLMELTSRYGPGEMKRAMSSLHNYAEKVMRSVIGGIPDGRYEGEDFLDDDGSGRADSVSNPTRIRVTLEVSGKKLKVDFSGSDNQVAGNLNAVEAITVSAVHYVLRCLAPGDIPRAGGLMRPVIVFAPEGTIVNARFPAATAAGNVETSQRIVDVLLKALSQALPDVIPAASSGSMNNLAFGGVNPETGAPYSYYETVGGGMGAGPAGDGDSGIHTHMTNSMNTPIEALEPYFPLRVREYRLRDKSGGRGRFNGGDGIIRVFEMLSSCDVTILSERRVHSPYGLGGGSPGRRGANSLMVGGRRRKLPGKISLRMEKGQLLMVETPGGGGWGKK